jgi:hypothetical protein
LTASISACIAGSSTGERPVHREASVVDERLGDHAPLLQLIDDGVRRSSRREVRGDRVRRHTVSLSQLAGEPVEPLAIACHEDDVATVGGEQSSKLEPDAPRRSGDDGGRRHDPSKNTRSIALLHRRVVRRWSSRKVCLGYSS